jgi:DNA repair exonuclease SbcCD nuclease subunit
MKFLHTADWQIGMKAVHAGKAGEKVREARFAAARRVVGIAREENVDFVVVAGDTFEDPALSTGVVQQAAEILAAADRPVYIISGNHDPIGPGSVWEHSVWKNRKNLHVLSECAPVETDSAILFPCPLFEAHPSADPTAWIPPGVSSKPRIGIAHGTLAGIPDAERCAPIAANAAERAGLVYLALGHFHSTRIEADRRMAYSGTHEPARFGEQDSGNVLLVTIDGPARIEPRSTAQLTWRQVVHTVARPEDLDPLKNLPLGRRLLLQITLDGMLPPAGFTALDELRESLASKCLYCSVDATRVRPESHAAEIPEGYFKLVEERLRALLDDPQQGAVARRALIELGRL